MACHHRLWEAQTVERRRAWHAIIALGRQTWSNDVRRDMPSPTLDSIHSRMTSGVACHHRLCAAYTIERRRTLHAIIAFGKHTRSNDIGHAMTSPPLDSTHGRMTSCVACHHCPWTVHTVKRRPAWHDIPTLGLHARSDDVGRGMTSPPLDSTHGRMTRGMARHHRP